MIKVAAGILTDNNKVFIAKRKQGKHLAGLWEFPGGKIEDSETAEQSLVREFREEFDVLIKVNSEFHQNQHHYPERAIQLKSFLVEYISGEFKLKEHDQIEWVEISDLDKYEIAPADIAIVEKLQNRHAIKRSYYSDSIDSFLKKSNNEILGELTYNHSNRALVELQRNAWIKQMDILRKTLHGFSGKIYFEFAIPRMGKRVDNIVIIKDTIFVIEFKVGDSNYEKYAQNQVLDYSLDLQNFHFGSHNARLIPILVATNAKVTTYEESKVLELIESVNTNSDSLRSIIQHLSSNRSHDLNTEEWEQSIYKPTPTIIEAAQTLYKGHNIKEISRSDSGAINLSKTANCLSRIIEDAKKNHKKTICFVTGVPGAGKTLAGLNIANERMKADEDEHAVFLSGNGPLVDVLREALARDLVNTTKEQGSSITKETAKRRTNTFIQNIHHFRDEYLKHYVEPTEKVVVFDEAQRAWNEKQVSSFMKRKKGVEDFNKSEPEFLVEVMDRHKDWCTIICLIGGGQEINTGEAGLEEWINAFKNRFKSWNVHYSNKIISNKNYLKSELLKDWLGVFGKVEPELHLAVSVRSFRSEKLSAFVQALLDIDLLKSQELYNMIKNDFPIYITRELSVAKAWLNSIKRGTERTGLIASSGARRLRACGIDVKNEISAPNWFLNDENDVRSSYFLEDIATEFDIQGLEIDYTCLAWGANFYFKNGNWEYQNFKGSKWQNINQEISRDYLKNTYRVLLTRARQGIIIYLPKGDKNDITRKSEYYEATYNYLAEVGIEEKTLHNNL